jgi:hypothetical protein
MSQERIQQKLEILRTRICDWYQDRPLADRQAGCLVEKLYSQAARVTGNFLDILLLSCSLGGIRSLPLAGRGENGRHGVAGAPIKKKIELTKYSRDPR